ncbi:Glu/Leu/Phe/Val dehydrogenase dimerization domain-containing protein [Aurantibacillus circumpalustris]|uniref:Glu/Leu/Phe/Val dehydrogenase dimerization domain-containing protein n=1 Tax=Aurantibacillus circumpalustris TaxID=3036359 RepID=UPI00295B7C7E|nr:Glu/Leu/Phe/Val dehydrogenase dimerization domain-containing protein [Aurantibacillus circumpalustris]
MEVKTLNNSDLIKNPVIGQMSLSNHEQILFCNDNATGLKAIIAIHNTVLGPSLGGTRMWNYNNEMEALTDVLRLSRGMTYKSSVAGLNLGGGKAVIIGDPKKIKNEALLRRFGKFVDSLGGKYITAEDVAMTSRDMEIIKMETDYVSGLPENMGGSGNPSPVTAYGVYVSMKASAKEVWGNDSLSGKKVLVQGIGHVGEVLVDHLTKEGAKVYIHDISEERLKLAAAKYKAEVVTEDKMFDLDIDIYAPCALGATVNDETLGKLKCKIICGAANNQLADEKHHGEVVGKQGILYAPDYVVNAGGIINVYYELEGYNRERAMTHAEKIYDTTFNLFQLAKKEGIPTYMAANRLGEERIAAIARINAVL